VDINSYYWPLWKRWQCGERSRMELQEVAWIDSWVGSLQKGSWGWGGSETRAGSLVWKKIEATVRKPEQLGASFPLFLEWKETIDQTSPLHTRIRNQHPTSRARPTRRSYTLHATNTFRFPPRNGDDVFREGSHWISCFALHTHGDATR
jgi:hypothetical protein